MRVYCSEVKSECPGCQSITSLSVDGQYCLYWFIIPCLDRIFRCGLYFWSRFEGTKNNFVIAVCDMAKSRINRVPWKEMGQLFQSEASRSVRRDTGPVNPAIRVWECSDKVWTPDNGNSLHDCPERVQARLVVCSIPVSYCCTRSPPSFSLLWISSCLALVNMAELLSLSVFRLSSCWYCSSVVFGRLSSHRLLSFSIISSLLVSKGLEYLVSRFVLLYSLLILIASFYFLMSVQLGPISRNKILQNMVWLLGNVHVWSVFAPSDTIFRSFAGPKTSVYALYWKLSNWSCNILVVSIFIRAENCVWHVITLVDSVLRLGREPVLLCPWNLYFLSHYFLLWRYLSLLIWHWMDQQFLAVVLLEACSPRVLIQSSALGLSTKRCYPRWKCGVCRTVLLNLRL